MTIEGLIDIHSDRIASLKSFLRRAHLGRRCKESAVARKVRRRLVGEIGQMLAYEEDGLYADLQYLASTMPLPRELDARAEPGCWDAWDHLATDFDPLPLLDAAPLFDGEGRAFDPSVGRWYRVMVGYPRKVTIAAIELGDLAALLDEMRARIGIGFTLDRYCWTESSLEQWVLGNQVRENTARGRAG